MQLIAGCWQADYPNEAGYELIEKLVFEQVEPWLS